MAALGLCAAPGAWAQGLTLPGGTQPGTLRTPLAAAAQCQECHGGATAPDGHAYMPGDLWPATMMANAVRDPLFRATMTTAEQDHPGIGTLCLRCHTPGGFTAGHATPGNGSALDPLTDLDGVHCDSCHRSIDNHAADPMAPYIGNARLYFDDASGGTAPTRHGPRTDPFMSNRHPSVGDPFIRDARMCGQCHDVDNPLVNRRTLAGADTGAPYPLQSTYTEWAQSDFARRSPSRTCQDCHMPAETAPLVVVRIPNVPLRPDHRRHDFLGANEWGMAMLRAAYPDEMNDAYDALRTRNQAFLQTSARVEVTAMPAEVRPGDPVRFTVRVTNLTGHKLPTGYEDARLMWLQVEAGGRVVSGAMADDELVEDPQLRAYRFVPGHLEGGRVVPDDLVTRHEVVVEDTRIPPEGMMPSDRTAPVGRDYAGGPGGALRHYDDAAFEVTAPATPGPFAITVRLMYRTTTRHYVETIAGGNHTDDTGTRLLAAWNASGRAAPFAMAARDVTVNISPTAPAQDAGVRDGGGSDGGVRDGSVVDGGVIGGPGTCGCRAVGLGGEAAPWRALAGCAAALGFAGIARRRRRR